MKPNIFIASFVKNDNIGGSVGMDYILRRIGTDNIMWFNTKSRPFESIDCYNYQTDVIFSLVSFVNFIFHNLDYFLQRIVFSQKLNIHLHRTVVVVYKKFAKIYALWIVRIINKKKIINFYFSLDNDFIYQLSEILLLLDAEKFHCVVSDDPAGALKMYGNLPYLVEDINKLVGQILRKSDKIYVISDGMRSYYKVLHGLDSIVTLPVNYTESRHDFRNKKTIQKIDTIRFIHIGHLRKSEVINTNTFLEALIENQIEFEFLFVGRSSSYYKDILKADQIRFLDWVEQAELNDLLDNSHFGYLPYSFRETDDIFVRTSFPNKLTSYSKRGLPTIFHGPSHSSAYDFVKENEIGICFDDILISSVDIWSIFNYNILEEQIVDVADRHFEPDLIARKYVD
jgi:hypothetical protein